jgi:RNA polymerase sigma-70 factor (ECF subfamily)
VATAVLEPPNEVALASRAATDPAAFAPIYDHYFPRVYNYIRYRVRRPDLTDDLTACTFERALVKIGSFDPERSVFAAWLFTIARNAVNDHLRARKRRRWVSLKSLRARSSEAPGADEVLIGQERRDRVLAAVARLSPREQDILSLKFAVGQTNREIAGLTGLTESNVGVILYRAVRKLRKELSVEEQSHA